MLRFGTRQSECAVLQQVASRQFSRPVLSRGAHAAQSGFIAALTQSNPVSIFTWHSSRYCHHIGTFSLLTFLEYLTFSLTYQLLIRFYRKWGRYRVSVATVRR